MENLKNLRQERGLTQNQLCEELKKQNYYISRSAYAKYEADIREMNYETLINLALFFNTSTDYIIGFSDKR